MKFRICVIGSAAGEKLKAIAHARDLTDACAIAHVLSHRRRGQPVQLWLRTKPAGSRYEEIIASECCDSTYSLKSPDQWKLTAEAALKRLAESLKAGRERHAWLKAHDTDGQLFATITASDQLRAAFFANQFTQLETLLNPVPA